MRKICFLIYLFTIICCNNLFSQTNNFLVAMNLRTNINVTTQPDTLIPVQTIIYFSPNGSDGLGIFDVPYLGGSGTGFFSYVAPNAFSINEMGAFTYDRTIRLGLIFPSNPGTFRISASDFLGYIGTSSLILEDTALNVFHDFRANPNYDVVFNGGNVLNRFKLHFSPPAKVTFDSDCFSNSLTLTNNSDSIVSYLVLNASQDTVFSGTNLADSSIINEVDPGLYYVSFTRGIYSSTDTINVVSQNPVVDLGAATQLSCETLTLDAQNPGLTYLWNTAATTQSIVVDSSSTYSVTVFNSNGCSASSFVNVTINQNPIVDLGQDITQCGGVVTLDAQNVGQSFLWNNTSTNQTIETDTSGVFVVNVIDGNGCSSSDSINVEISNLAISGELFASTNIVDVSDQIEIIFNLNIIGAVDSIVWDFGDGDTLHNLLSANHFFDTEGEYTVTATVYNNSCSLILQTQIIVSNTTSISFTPPSSFELRILENKFIEIDNVKKQQNIQIDIYSIDGKLISTEIITANQNSINLIPINENLRSGLYITKVKSNKFELNKKFIVSNK
jgi:hypothetical protein